MNPVVGRFQANEHFIELQIYIYPSRQDIIGPNHQGIMTSRLDHVSTTQA